jgi:hypothetical protein
VRLYNVHAVFNNANSAIHIICFNILENEEKYGDIY